MITTFIQEHKLVKRSDGKRGRHGYQKQWRVRIYKKETTGSYLVVTYWGRGESGLFSLQSKTVEATPYLSVAQCAAAELVRAKKDKGYRECETV
jgi:predicted DNA-binding WGR domain protein